MRRRVFNISVFLLFIAFSFFIFSKGLVSAETSDEESDYKNAGPLRIRNQMPLHLIYLQMIPDKASVRERNKFTTNANYTVSNISVSAFTPISSLYDIDIDLEVSTVTLDFRYGLYDNLEIGFEVPYTSFSSGYLDDLIEGIEDGIGARTPRSRERQGSNEFDYSFIYNSRKVISMKKSVEGIGDMILNAKYQLLQERGWFLPNFSIRSSVKFPTAEEDDMLGSGEFDYGLGILMDKSFFGRVFLYGGANIVAIEKPKVFDELGIGEHIYSYVLALEYCFTKRFSVVTQASGNTTPYPYSDTNPLDNDSHDFGIAFNYTCKEKSDISCHFGITENISAASSPDVSLQTGLTWKF